MWQNQSKSSHAYSGGLEGCTSLICPSRRKHASRFVSLEKTNRDRNPRNNAGVYQPIGRRAEAGCLGVGIRRAIDLVATSIEREDDDMAIVVALFSSIG